LEGVTTSSTSTIPSYSSATDAVDNGDNGGLVHSVSSRSIAGEEGFFDTNFDEQAFVSALFESNGGYSVTALP